VIFPKAFTLVLLFAVVGTSTAQAQDFFCRDGAITALIPSHPGPADPVKWFTFWDMKGIPVGWQALSKAYLLPGNLIDIDVVVTADVAAFPGYQPVQDYPHGGTFGPLAAGQYLLAPSVRTFDPATQASTLQCTGSAQGLTIFSLPGATATAPVVEFYNESRDHYFMTQDPAEIGKLDSGATAGWTRTGYDFLAYLPEQSDGRGGAIARFYGLPSAGLDSHVFTNSDDEIFEIVNGRLKGAWVYETPRAFDLPHINRKTGACPAGTRPLFRLWNGRLDSNHRYTTDAAVKRRMLALGYVLEGYGRDHAFLCAL